MSLPATRPRVAALVAALGVWSVLWFVPWPLLMSEAPWLRSAIGFGAFLVPGVALHAWIDRAARLSGRVAYGFALSVVLTGLIGFTACLLHWQFATVRAALWLAGATSMALLARTDCQDTDAKACGAVEFADSFYLLPCFAVTLIAARFALAPAGGIDNFTQIARITGFLQSHALGFGSVGFGDAVTVPPRYWLAYWSMSEAVIASVSGVHPLELATNYLGPLLAALSFVCLYELARSLGFSRRLTAMALTAHLASLILLTGRGQAGRFFFIDVTEDKVMAAFVLAPVCFAAVTSYWAAPTTRRLILVGLCHLASALTHATSFGVTCLITGAYGIGELFATAAVPQVARALAVVAIVAAAASIPRFAPHPARALIHFTVADAVSVGEFARVRAKRLIVDSSGRFALALHVIPKPARLLGVAILLSALSRIRRNRAARFVTGALAVVALTIITPVAWIMGLVITPFHLWRVPWQAPFGIGGAWLLYWVADELRPLLERWRRAARWRVAPVLLVAGQLALLLGVSLVALPHRRNMLISLHKPANWLTRVYTIDEVVEGRVVCRRTYADLINMGRVIDTLAPDGAVVVGDLPNTNSFIPSVSTKARLVVFREPDETAQHASLSLAEAKARTATLTRLFATDTLAVERLRILADYRVEFLLQCGPSPAAAQLATEYPDAVRLAATAGDFQLYRVSVNAPAASARD